MSCRCLRGAAADGVMDGKMAGATAVMGFPELAKGRALPSPDRGDRSNGPASPR